MHRGYIPFSANCNHRRMKSQISFTLYFQVYLYFSFAEWVEISKSPRKDVNDSVNTFKIAAVSSDSIASRENSEEIENDNKHTFMNKVLIDEQIMEQDLSKEVKTDIEDKGSNYFGFIPFIENIQSSLMKNAHQGIKSKINLLQELKYNLLFNIKEKISSLWRPASPRKAREYYDKEEETHMDFPSNEGALMTIGFLTFAVFLIKLVLKLIYALKYKNGTAVNPNATPVILGRRRKREAFDEEAAKILQLIEEYKFT